MSAESFLSSVKVSELSSGTKEIFHIDSHQSAREALELMIKKNVYAVPVYENQKPMGLLNLRSVVTFIVNLFYSQAGIQKNEDSSARLQKLGKHSFTNDEIKAVTDAFNKHSVRDLTTSSIVVHPSSASVKDIIIDLAKNERVAIGDSNGRVIDIISQAVVVKFLLKNLDKLGSQVNDKLENLNVITSPVQTVPVRTPTLISFAKMIEGNFSSLGITDEEHQVVGIISFKDIRGAAEEFRSLFLATENYINGIRRQDFRDVNPTVNCKSTDTLARAIAKLDAVGIHRLFVSTEKDTGHHFSGILTLADVLNLFVKRR